MFLQVCVKAQATLVIVLLIRRCTATATSDGCLISRNSCYCAPGIASRQCLHAKNKDHCSLTSCTESFRCDCSGFEVCALALCAKPGIMEGGSGGGAVPLAEATRSLNASEAVGCSPRGGKGVCIAAGRIRLSAPGVTAALSAAERHGDSVADGAVAAAKSFREMLLMYAGLQQVLRDVERVAEHVAAADLAAIGRDAANATGLIRTASAGVRAGVEQTAATARAWAAARMRGRVVLAEDKEGAQAMEAASKEAAEQCGSAVRSMREAVGTVREVVHAQASAKEEMRALVKRCVERTQDVLAKLGESVPLYRYL